MGLAALVALFTNTVMSIVSSTKLIPKDLRISRPHNSMDVETRVNLVLQVVVHVVPRSLVRILITATVDSSNPGRDEKRTLPNGCSQNMHRQ